jgi:hypothetical protein
MAVKNEISENVGKGSAVPDDGLVGVVKSFN